MKHTPGPWEVSRNNAGAIPLHFQPPEVLGRGGKCCVASSLGNGPEAEANARLIAAAPELLEALKRWTDEAKKFAIANHFDISAEGTAFSQAIAAIAKAEGR